MIQIEAKLVGLTSNPHNEDAPWEAKFALVDSGLGVWDAGRVFAFSVPVSLEEALSLGPHVGQYMSIGIAPQYQPGTVQL